MKKQLNLFEEIEIKDKIDKPYYNLKGEILPWEDPEYLSNYEKINSK